MYVIIAYDVSVERVNKVKGYLRTQLTWVQNSLFEGELSESRYMAVESKLKKLCNLSEDSVTIYIFPNEKAFGMEDIGVKKGGSSKDVVL